MPGIDSTPGLDAQTYQVEATQDHVELPNGVNYDTGHHANLTIDEFLDIQQSVMPSFVKLRGMFTPMDGFLAPHFEPDLLADFVFAPIDLSELSEDDDEEVVRIKTPTDRLLVDHAATVGLWLAFGLGVFTGTDATADFTLHTAEWDGDPDTEAGDELQMGDTASMTVEDGVAQFLGISPSAFIQAGGQGVIKPGEDLVVRSSSVSPFDSGILVMQFAIAYLPV
jgi:hypothetical protein